MANKTTTPAADTAQSVTETKPGVINNKNQENTQAQTKATKENPFEILAKQYAKQYPKCRTFYITSDKQVFLSGDRNMAVMHQNSLKDGEEIRTVNID